MDYTRKQVIEMILKHLNIRLSLDKIYENYTNGKYHKKVIEYNKKKGAIHPRNPWCLYLNGEPLPEFIMDKDLKKEIENNWKRVQYFEGSRGVGRFVNGVFKLL